MQKIPGIGDIPIIGNLFKSKAAQKDQTELVVMITPQILQRKSAGVTSTLPGTPESFLEPTPAKKLVEPLPEAFTPQRSGVAGTGAMKPSAGMPGSAAPAPAAAPASSSASTPAPGAETTQKVDNTQPANAGAPPLSAKEQKKLDEANRKKAQAEQEAQDKAAREQAKRDAEAAKVAAEQAKRQARIDAEAAKTAAERAKHQADAEKSHQKTMD
jgi:uncharacterized membrane protein YqiK